MPCSHTDIYLRFPLKSLGIRDGRAHGIVEPVPCIVLVGGCLVVITASQIHRSRETRAGTGLGILVVAPLDVVDGTFSIIRKTSLAGDHFFIIEAQVTTEPVTKGI